MGEELVKVVIPCNAADSYRVSLRRTFRLAMVQEADAATQAADLEL